MPPKDPGVQLLAYVPPVADIGVDARYRDDGGLGRDWLMITVSLAGIENHTMLVVYHFNFSFDTSVFKLKLRAPRVLSF